MSRSERRRADLACGPLTVFLPRRVTFESGTTKRQGALQERAGTTEIRDDVDVEEHVPCVVLDRDLTGHV